MKHYKPLLLIVLMLCGCGKKFTDIMARAEKAYTDKNYVDVIDALNNGFPYWKESDGSELKGRGYELLGKSYHQLRNTDKAIVAYKHAIELSNQSFDSAFALGNLYLIKNQPVLARQVFQTALRMKPGDPLALLGLGNSYYAEKKIPEAIDTFEQVLNVSPGVREAQEQLLALRARNSRKSTTLKIHKKSGKTSVKKSNQRK